MACFFVKLVGIKNEANRGRLWRKITRNINVTFDVNRFHWYKICHLNELKFKIIYIIVICISLKSKGKMSFIKFEVHHIYI